MSFRLIKNHFLTIFFGCFVITNFFPVNVQAQEEYIFVLRPPLEMSHTTVSKLKIISKTNEKEINEQKMIERQKFQFLWEKIPDNTERRNFELRQAKIYYQAQQKLKAHRNFNPFLKNPEQFLTSQEKDALNYFHGKGLYKIYQDPKTLPNLFDTRLTLIKKLQNPTIRQAYLERFER